MSTPIVIDLDAARREAQVPESIPLIFKTVQYELAAELPVEVFDPLLSEELDLLAVIRDFLDDDESDEETGDKVVETLFSRPDLPREVVQAVHDCIRCLFGPGQYEQFMAAGPSLQDLVRMLSALLPVYGVGLGEAFRSLISSDDDGATSKQTSEPPATTPEASSPSAARTKPTKRAPTKRAASPRRSESAASAT